MVGGAALVWCGVKTTLLAMLRAVIGWTDSNAAFLLPARDFHISEALIISPDQYACAWVSRACGARAPERAGYWHRVPGHKGILGNEIADQFEAAGGRKWIVDANGGYQPSPSREGKATHSGVTEESPLAPPTA